jgi:hypothetical protein
MAIAKPVRALIILSIVLWGFFLWQLLGDSSSGIAIRPPNRYSHERDPNLDRKSRLHPVCRDHVLTIMLPQRRANQKAS